MVSQKVTIKNPTGLHLRPAGILCKEAVKYQALITFNFKGGTANAKSHHLLPCDSAIYLLGQHHYTSIFLIGQHKYKFSIFM